MGVEKESGIYVWQEIARFSIERDAAIVVLRDQDREEWYCHCCCTDTLIFYETELFCVILEFESIQEAMLSIRNGMVRALQWPTQLPRGMNAGRVGYHYSIDNERSERQKHYLSYESVDYGSIRLLSELTSETWMYTAGKKMYLEIAPFYRRLYSERPLWRKPRQQQFKHFMRDYKPIAVHVISPEQAWEWIPVCDKIIFECIGDHIKDCLYPLKVMEDQEPSDEGAANSYSSTSISSQSEYSG